MATINTTKKEPSNWVLVGQENEIVVTDSDPESDGISVISEYSLLQDSNNEEDHNNEISEAAEAIGTHIQDVQEIWTLSQQDQPNSSNTNQFYLNCLQEPVLEITDNDLESTHSEESEVPAVEPDPVKDLQLIQSEQPKSYFTNYWLIILFTTLISSLLVGLFLTDPADTQSYEDNLETPYNQKVQFPYELAYCIENQNGNINNLESAIGHCLDQLSATDFPKVIELNLKEKLLEMKEKELLLREMKLLKAELNMRKKHEKNKKIKDKFIKIDENNPNKFKKNVAKAQRPNVLKDSSTIKPNVTKSMGSNSEDKKGTEKLTHNINKRNNYQKVDKSFKKEFKQKQKNTNYQSESRRGKPEKLQKFMKTSSKPFKKIKDITVDPMKSKWYKKLKQFFKKGKSKTNIKNDKSLDDNLKELIWFLSQSSPNTYYNFIKSNLTKKSGTSSENLFINKTLDGDWYLRLYKNRDDIRKKEHMADWYFDRSYMRKRQRLDKANWYFDLMSSRDKVRYSY